MSPSKVDKPVMVLFASIPQCEADSDPAFGMHIQQMPQLMSTM